MTFSKLVWSWGFAGWVGLACVCALPCRASLTEVMATPEVVQTLEIRADAATVREQCYLYSELLHTLTELEGQQLDAGDHTGASETLTRMERVVAKMKRVEMADAKRLKNAEALLEHATRRLGDMLHLASGEERAAMKATLEHLDRAHDELLALVFAK